MTANPRFSGGLSKVPLLYSRIVQGSIHFWSVFSTCSFKTNYYENIFFTLIKTNSNFNCYLPSIICFVNRKHRKTCSRRRRWIKTINWLISLQISVTEIIKIESTYFKKYVFYFMRENIINTIYLGNETTFNIFFYFLHASHDL